MRTLGEFAGQPLIDVTFEMPDPAGGADTQEVMRVHRGTTGVIHRVLRPGLGYEGGVEVRAIIDAWEGDTPITHVETVRV